MLEIRRIRRDGGTQPRESIDYGVVDDYAEAMQAGVILPAVTVYYDGATYWLADGFHRVEAALKLERESIDAEVKQGTRRDAQWHSFGANKTHGLRRAKGDAKRAIEKILLDEEWAKTPQTKIAEHVGVSQPYVAEIKRHLISTYKIPERGPVEVTRNGTTYTQDTSNIGCRPQATEDPEDTESPEDSEAEPEDQYGVDELSDDGNDDEERDDHTNRPSAEDTDSGGSRDTQSDRSKRTWQRAHVVVHEIESENTKKSNPWEILGLSSAEQIAESFELEWLEVTRNLTAKVRHDAANKLLVFFRNQTIELNRMAAS